MQIMAALSEVLEYLVVVSYHSVFSSLCNRSELVALHDFGNAKGWVHRETIAPASPFPTSDIQGGCLSVASALNQLSCRQREDVAFKPDVRDACWPELFVGQPTMQNSGHDGLFRATILQNHL